MRLSHASLRGMVDARVVVSICIRMVTNIAPVVLGMKMVTSWVVRTGLTDQISISGFYGGGAGCSCQGSPALTRVVRSRHSESQRGSNIEVN